MATWQDMADLYAEAGRDPGSLPDYAVDKERRVNVQRAAIALDVQDQARRLGA